MRRFRLQATGLLVVSVLSGFVLSSPTRAADADQLFAALPEETGVVVEVRHPIELIDKLLNHPRRAQLEQLPDVAKALKTPQVVMAQTGLLWLEGEIGTSWREALRVAMGDGVWFVGQEPQNAMTLIAKSPQPERLDKLIPLFATWPSTAQTAAVSLSNRVIATVLSKFMRSATTISAALAITWSRPTDKKS